MEEKMETTIRFRVYIGVIIQGFGLGFVMGSSSTPLYTTPPRFPFY